MNKNLPNYLKNLKGFTLVEVLVVIGIITILSALVITALDPPQLRRAARDTNRKKDLAVITAALEQYYADNNSYPDADMAGLVDVLDGTSSGVVYLKSVSTSQSTVPIEYCYSRLDSQNFVLCAPLEAEPTNVSTVNQACEPASPIGSGTYGTDYGSYCMENPF